MKLATCNSYRGNANRVPNLGRSPILLLSRQPCIRRVPPGCTVPTQPPRLLPPTQPSRSKPHTWFAAVGHHLRSHIADGASQRLTCQSSPLWYRPVLLSEQTRMVSSHHRRPLTARHPSLMTILINASCSQLRTSALNCRRYKRPPSHSCMKASEGPSRMDTRQALRHHRANS